MRNIRCVRRFTGIIALFFVCNLIYGQGNPLKIMSYNIHIASPPSTKPEFTHFDIDAIADVINRENPDLIALQEVDRYTQRSGREIHQAEKLAELTGMKYFFAPAEKKSDGFQGVAILSKYPIKEGIKPKLPTRFGSNGETRSLAGVLIEVDGDEILFLCTHLDHLSIEDREYQCELILDEINDYVDYPIIFAGDFNSEIHRDGDRVYALLAPQFKLINTEPPLTFPQINPKVAIDHILLNNAALNLFSVVDYYTVEEDYASDHLPLILEVKKQ